MPVRGARVDIYIVEDDEAVRAGFTRLIRSAGLEPHGIDSLTELMHTEMGPAGGCIVLDMECVDSPPREAELRQFAAVRKVPVVAVSAIDNVRVRDAARRIGAQFFLRKPVDDQALIDALNWVTQGHACVARSSEAGFA